MKPAYTRVGFASALANVMLFAPLFLHAQSHTSAMLNTDTAEIAKLEDRWLNAIQTSDIATLDAIVADDFLRPAPAAGQFITKSQLLDYYKSHHPAPGPAGKHIENLQVRFYGTVAIARGFVVDGDTQEKAPSKSLFTDVFVKRAGKWQAISAQEN